jgi:phospholipid-transporting ATPase
MMIPSISSTDGKPVVFLPLSIIMFVNITKNVFEDRKRAASDKKENTSKVPRS